MVKVHRDTFKSLGKLNDIGKELGTIIVEIGGVKKVLQCTVSKGTGRKLTAITPVVIGHGLRVRRSKLIMLFSDNAQDTRVIDFGKNKPIDNYSELQFDERKTR